MVEIIRKLTKGLERSFISLFFKVDSKCFVLKFYFCWTEKNAQHIAPDILLEVLYFVILVHDIVHPLLHTQHTFF